MLKLNQNYLDIIRDNLCNKKQVKNVKSHSKNEKVSSQEKASLNAISKKPIINIKKFEKIKIKKPELEPVESLNTEKLPKKNSVKRKLSISPNLPIKKIVKKKKIIISPSKDSPQKSKINNKGYNFGPYLNGYKEFSKKKSSEEIEENLPTGHFYDDDPNLNVKNLMIKNFFKLFKTRVFDNNEQHLQVPRKFFKFSENDLVDEIIIHHQNEEEIVEDHSYEEEINSKELNDEVNDVTVVEEEEEEEVEADKRSVNQQIINIDEENETDIESEDDDNNITDEEIVDEQVPNNTDDGALSILDLENGNKVLILNQMDQKIHFNGLCYVEVLYGEIEILGAVLNKSSKKSYKVYSPRGTSLIYIKNNIKLYSEDKIDLNNIISQQSLKIPSYSSVVLLKKLEEFHVRFIEDNIMHKIFPYNSFDNTIRVNFELSSGQFNKIQYTYSWEEILDEEIPDDSKSSIFMICGGKNVGKSTFLRYSVNSLLGRFKEICVLDLDPGQSEFSPPGFLSLSKIGEFLLGPNYTHLKSPEIMVLTNINVGFNAEKYLNNVKHLLKYWNENSLNNTPLLINSPGFTQGLGSNIIMDVIKETHPTAILEIISKIPTKNYNFDLAESNEELNYEYRKLNSLSENNEAWSLEARQFREISILSYFGKLMNQNINNLSDFNIDMLSINISSLKIINNEGKTLNPWTINGNLVALCSICPKPDDFDVLIGYGYGLVRGMDLEQDILILITPEPVETLQNVTHLVISPTILPPTILMGAQNVQGHVPYISTGDLIDLGQLTKRSYIPPKEKLINNIL